jgi:hypothetical protein
MAASLIIFVGRYRSGKMLFLGLGTGLGSALMRRASLPAALLTTAASSRPHSSVLQKGGFISKISVQLPPSPPTGRTGVNLLLIGRRSARANDHAAQMLFFEVP